MSPSWIPPPKTRTRGRRSRYDAIVIGSGVGGCVVAGLLAHAEARILVLEKNESVGGILASYRKHGFKIDAGSHLVSRGAKGPLGDALRAIGATRPRFLTHEIPVRSRGMFEIAAPKRRWQLPEVALQAARALHVPMRDGMRLGHMLFDMFTLAESELQRWDRKTLDAFVRGYTEHPGAYYLFGFLASIFFVLPPWQVSAGEAIRSLRWLLRAYSLSYVEGGMDCFCHAMLGPLEAAGGDLVTGRRVVRIRRAAGAWQVVSEDGAEYVSPTVVCNLEPRQAIALLDDTELPPAYRERVLAVKASGNAHQIKLGLRRPLVSEGCMIGGVSLDGLTLADLSLPLMHDLVDTIAAGGLPDPLALYAPVPTNYDPTLAPDGAQLIVASIFGPVREDPADPPSRWRARALQALAQIVPGLEDELLFVDFTPITEIGSWMGRSSRGAIGNGQFPGQVGADRLPVVTPARGVYLCGDGAGGRGIGTELAVSSAMEAVHAIRTARS